MMKDIVKSLTLDDFVKKMLANEIKAKVLKECRKIYPVRNFEIRRTELIL